MPTLAAASHSSSSRPFATTKAKRIRGIPRESEPARIGICNVFVACQFLAPPSNCSKPLSSAPSRCEAAHGPWQRLPTAPSHVSSYSPNLSPRGHTSNEKIWVALTVKVSQILSKLAPCFKPAVTHKLQRPGEIATGKSKPIPSFVSLRPQSFEILLAGTGRCLTVPDYEVFNTRLSSWANTNQIRGTLTIPSGHKIGLSQFQATGPNGRRPSISSEPCEAGGLENRGGGKLEGCSIVQGRSGVDHGVRR
jgi:hypothetical protein